MVISVAPILSGCSSRQFGNAQMASISTGSLWTSSATAFPFRFVNLCILLFFPVLSTLLLPGIADSFLIAGGSTKKQNRNPTGLKPFQVCLNALTFPHIFGSDWHKSRVTHTREGGHLQGGNLEIHLSLLWQLQSLLLGEPPGYFLKNLLFRLIFRVKQMWGLLSFHWITSVIAPMTTNNKTHQQRKLIFCGFKGISCFFMTKTSPDLWAWFFLLNGCVGTTGTSNISSPARLLLAANCTLAFYWLSRCAL